MHSEDLLNAFGIKDQTRNVSKKKIHECVSMLFHPFSIFMHCSSLYNIVVLGRTILNQFTIENKSAFSSMFNSVLSLVVWYVVRNRRNSLHSSIKKCKHISIDDGVNRGQTYKLQKILIMAFLFPCFIMPVLLAFYMAVRINFDIGGYLQFWFVGFDVTQPSWFYRALVFLFAFAYTSQQTSFSTLFIAFFSVSALNLAEDLNQLKMCANINRIWKVSLPTHAYIHKKLLKQAQKYEEIFAFPLFLLMCQIIFTGFTSLALEMQNSTKEIDCLSFKHLESIYCLYFCTVTVITATYAASMVSSLQKGIIELYRNAYEMEVERAEKSPNLNDERKRMILRMMSERQVIHLTAWNFIRLDKQFVFTVFGGMITYGFLILQLNNYWFLLFIFGMTSMFARTGFLSGLFGIKAPNLVRTSRFFGLSLLMIDLLHKLY